MTTIALETNSRQHLEMILSLAQKLKIKSKIFEDDLVTPYEKNINGESFTLKQLSEHLEAIADKNDTMSYDEFKKKLQQWK
ncbi:hypothetical protein LV89_00649 [Arcicella aurantiaca]|uniref:Uncharacterized protein n=1 Tax=Arcicella aurantiaca TaxID=591202 RepID=A0A316EYV0_9BACT|nr:hypothetical protein [Arcicella aurantiaca]PWK28445.1 hypothetical protein LV89_00649 [Arcicella aurantiaca]